MSSTFNYKMNNLCILEWRFKKSVFLCPKSIFVKIFGKMYWAEIKAFSLAKSLSTGNSKSFFVQQISNIIYLIYFIIKTWKSLGIILIDMNQRIR